MKTKTIIFTDSGVTIALPCDPGFIWPGPALFDEFLLIIRALVADREIGMRAATLAGIDVKAMNL
ncbi:MAG: hypothetical protein A3H24_08385 [Rhodoferax sp. RIFCSPLOWO2_12_FULL_60_11]|jgi:hypothetical protein|nr:MAG: hypothetical protein A3H24_08385 [Rhodoferax sp. RIFCSPLOWO2_12_FULL_60_11]